MQTVWMVFLVMLALGSSLGTSLRSPQPSPAVQAEPRLDVRIPPADPARYRAIQESRDWQNPRLDVSRDGYRLRSRSLPSGIFVSPADLRRALTSLPVEDRPLRRVAVVRSPSIMPADDAWIAAMRRNTDAAIELLRTLDADWWAWPPSFQNAPLP